MAYLVTRSADDAEEATQDGFVKAWKALDRFHDGAPFAPWLLHIVRNEALNRVRSRARRRKMQLRVQERGIPVSPPAESEALSLLEGQILAGTVDQLPDALRDVIHCLYLLDFSEVETATVLGIPRGTVKSRAARARGILSHQIGVIA